MQKAFDDIDSKIIDGCNNIFYVRVRDEIDLAKNALYQVTVQNGRSSWVIAPMSVARLIALDKALHTCEQARPLSTEALLYIASQTDYGSYSTSQKTHWYDVDERLSWLPDQIRAVKTQRCLYECADGATKEQYRQSWQKATDVAEQNECAINAWIMNENRRIGSLQRASVDSLSLPSATMCVTAEVHASQLALRKAIFNAYQEQLNSCRVLDLSKFETRDEHAQAVTEQNEIRSQQTKLAAEAKAAEAAQAKVAKTEKDARFIKTFEKKYAAQLALDQRGFFGRLRHSGGIANKPSTEIDDLVVYIKTHSNRFWRSRSEQVVRDMKNSPEFENRANDILTRARRS